MNILADILSATVLFAVPLLLVALGGMFSERSGVINIALEGIMVIGALISCLLLRAFDLSGFGAANPQLAMLIAVLAAGLSGVSYSLLLAFASINLKADQTIGGTALNMLSPAFAVVLTWAIQGQGNTTILIPGWVRITAQSAGIADNGGFWVRMIFKSLYLTTPLALLLLAASAFILYKTRLGLRLRACGEHPQAADSVGVNVYKMRYLGVTISGLLGGIGGLAFVAGQRLSKPGRVWLPGAGGDDLWQLEAAEYPGASLFFASFKIIGSYSAPFLPADFKNVRSAVYLPDAAYIRL